MASEWEREMAYNPILGTQPSFSSGSGVFGTYMGWWLQKGWKSEPDDVNKYMIVGIEIEVWFMNEGG